MEKQQQELYSRVFSRFDEDGDGRLSPDELRRCIESMGCGGGMTEAEAEEAVALMDSDGDGLLCFDDFVRVVDGVGEEERDRDLKGAFEMYVEGSGCDCITPKSLRRMLSRLGERRTVDQCQRMIALFDLNGDGVLNLDEFKAMMTNLH